MSSNCAAVYERNLSSGLSGKYSCVASLLAPRSAVLELGCASGFFSVELMKRGHRLVGLEQDKVAVQVCRERGVDVRLANLSAADPLSSVRGEQFDCALAMDILEHLPEPESLLNALHPVLRDGGRLIVTGPNVAYWAVRFNLLMGRWDYGRAGIMDNSHLRWFTRRTWKRLLEDSCFMINRHGSAESMLPKETWLGSIGIRGKRLEALRLAATRLRPELFTTVFFFEATLRRGDGH